MNVINNSGNTTIKTYFRQCNFCSNYFRTPQKEYYFCSDICEANSKVVIKKTCNICRRQFFTTNSYEKFCSDICEQKSRLLIKKTCDICRRRFTTQYAYERFCSDICEAKSKQFIKKTCIRCSKEFDTIESQSNFCSLDCESMYDELNKNKCKLCEEEVPFSMKGMSFCCETCKVEYENILIRCYSMIGEGKLITLDILRQQYIEEKRKQSNHLVIKKDDQSEIKKDDYLEVKKNNLPGIKKESDGTYKIKCEICEQEFHTRQINKTVCSIICREKKFKLKKNTPTNKQYTQEEQMVIEQVKYLIETALASKNIGSFSEYGFTESLKDRVKERDDYTCQICGSGLQLEVHHIVPRRCGGLNIEENLITLCVSCHRAIETKDIERATKKCLRNYNKDDLTHKYINYEAMYMDKQIKMKSLFNNIVQTFEENEVKRKILQTLNEIIEEV